ncbi:MAG: hypothetical protein R3C01_09150 [Planctomycetaceae bacterium]
MARLEAPSQLARTSAFSLPEIVDHFLDWVQRNRAADTFEWYRYRLERLCQIYPTMAAERLRPFHVEEMGQPLRVVDHLASQLPAIGETVLQLVSKTGIPRDRSNR